MKIYGNDVPQHDIDAVVAAMRTSAWFTYGTLMLGFKHVPSRAIDRIIQRERKAGNIEYDNSVWRWTKQ